MVQVVSHVVQKDLAGEQETHWDKTNQELTSSKIIILFVSLAPVRFLFNSKVFLYHVTFSFLYVCLFVCLFVGCSVDCLQPCIGSIFILHHS